MAITKYLKIVGINLILLILFIEFMSMAYVKIKDPDQGYLKFFPTYIDFTMDDEYIQLHDPLGPHFIDTAYTWSTWHPRNSIFRHKKTCFDVMMKFNELGTRGRLPNPADTNTVLFVGDSFTEGYGLPEDSTVPALVSVQKNTPVLNLGSSGYVGTTQFGLIYDHFSKLFQHKEVYVLLHLNNDFQDNRMPDSTQEEFKRYKPYRADTADLSKIIYTGSLERNPNSREAYLQFMNNGNRMKVKDGMRHHFSKKEGSIFSKLFTLTYTSRVLYILKKLTGEKASVDLYYASRDLKILDYDLKFITDIANRSNAKVTFINIPHMRLITEALQNPDANPSYLKLEKHISDMFSTGPHRFLSFYNYLLSSGQDPKTLVFECDMHYNPRGMEVLVDFISKNWRE